MFPLLLCGNMAVAAPTAEALSEYRQAAKRFSVLIAEAEVGDKTVQLRSAEFSMLVAILSDERKILVEGPFSTEESETDIEICGLSNKAVMALMLFDLKAAITQSQDQQALITEFNALMARNILLFQDELMALQPFLFRCLAKQIRGLERFIVSLPPEQLTDVRRGGAVKMRRGILMTYFGILSAASDPAYKEGYRLTLLAALAETAESFALAMPLSERKRIADATELHLALEDKRMSAYAMQIRSAFRSEKCSTLCAIE